MSIYSKSGKLLVPAPALSIPRQQGGATPPAIGAAISGTPSGMAALHEAASSVRRLKGWKPTDAHINTILRSSGAELLRRSRNLVQTNAYALSAQESFSHNLIGTGIAPTCLLQGEIREQINELFSIWSDEADADGQTSFYGLQTLAAFSLFEAGEVFVRMRSRRPQDGLSVPFQLQLIEAEQLDRLYNVELPNGNIVRCGIEFNKIGQRVAYHFWKQHPGDLTFPLATSERTIVPAAEVLHVYEMRRPGQLRGVPRTLAGMVRAYILDQYDDAMLDRAKVAALVAAWIKKPEEGSYWSNETEQTSLSDSSLTEAIAEWSPGSINELLPGEEVTISEPADAGSTYEPFQYRNLTAISVAWGVPYAAMSGDMLKANYSNMRAALLEFRRRISPTQDNVIRYQFCRPIWRRFIETAVLDGTLQGNTQEMVRQVRWIMPKWDWVDPLKDRNAEKVAVEMGVKSLSDVQEAEGYDPEDVAKRRAADIDRAERYGLEHPYPTQQPQPNVAGMPADQTALLFDQQQTGAA